jgi:hypothetical protein
MTAEKDENGLNDPRTNASAFWAALSDQEVFEVLTAAPKVALWRKTRNGAITFDGARCVDVTFDGARCETQAIGGINPDEQVAAEAKARGYRVPNTKGTPVAWPR